jgi:hypothetical protein
MAIPFSVNATVPPSGAGVTVAINSTGSCGTDGLADDVTAVIVGISTSSSIEPLNEYE